MYTIERRSVPNLLLDRVMVVTPMEVTTLSDTVSDSGSRIPSVSPLACMHGSFLLLLSSLLMELNILTLPAAVLILSPPLPSSFLTFYR